MTAPPMSEQDFQQQVTDLAELYSWSWVHFRPAQTAKGWRTPVSGPLGKGWPDLILVRARDQRVIFAELKTDAGKATADQAATLAFLTESGAEAHLWRPRDFDAIQEVLR